MRHHGSHFMSSRSACASEDSDNFCRAKKKFDDQRGNQIPSPSTTDKAAKFHRSLPNLSTMKPGQDERVNVAVKKLVKYSNLTIPDATKLADFTPDECATKGLAERVRRRGPSKKEWRKALSAPVMVSSGATESDISSLTTSPQKNGPTKPPSEADRKRMTSSQLQEDRIHKAKMKKHNKASHKRCSGRLRWASAVGVCGGRRRWTSAVGVGGGQ